MNFDFYVTKTPIMTVPTALKTVYVLHADSTYDVKKEFSGSADLVALRTYDNVEKEFMDSTDLVALRTYGGEGRMLLRGLPELTLLPGSLLLFRHSDIRRYYCSKENWDFWWFEFTPGELLELPLNTLIQIEILESEEADFETCLRLLKKDSTTPKYLASATLGKLLHGWLHYFGNSSAAHPHQKALQKAMSYIRANVNKKIFVKDLAEITGLCERRFRQVFIETAGIGPKAFIETLRMDMAEELLRSTPFSISEISERLGYSSQFHFCKTFKRTHSIAPSEYRRSGN